jgi:hypothetical protein
MANNEITIYDDGSWDPPGGVTINPGGVVKIYLDAGIPAGSIVTITFVNPIDIEPAVEGDLGGGGTIKVGSGN